MGEAMELHRRATALHEALEEQRDKIRASGGAAVDQRDWKARAERLDGYGIEVKQARASLLELGGHIKDLEMGLADFPGLGTASARAQPVTLCWLHCGDRLRAWHRVHEGYA